MKIQARQALAAALLGITLTTVGCSDSPDSLLAKAKESLAKNERKAAEIHLKNLLQKEDRAEARFLLGQVHIASGDFKSAEKEIQRALDGGYDPTKAGIAMTAVHLGLGEPAKAIERGNKLGPTLAPDIAELQGSLGRAYLALNKRDDAEKAYKAALAAVPDYLPARLGMVVVAAGKDIRIASTEIDALLAKVPNSTEAMALKADLELAQGRRAEGITWLEKVAAGEAQNRAVRAKLASLYGEMREFDKAQKSIDELKKLTGPAPGTMYLQAFNDFRQGKNEAARDAIQATLKSAPSYVPALALAATIYLNLNSYELAESSAKTVLEKAPNSTLGYRLLGATYLKMGSAERALQAVLPAVDRGAKDPLLLGIAGEAALRLNEADRAAGYFTKATELSPNDATQKVGRGVARIAAGDKERGLADLESAAELNPTNTQAELALITQHLKDQQWDKALAAIDRLDKKQPNNPLNHNLRGSVSLGKNDIPGARKHFEAALGVDPKFFAAVANLATLDLREKKFDDAKKRFTTLLEKDAGNVRALLSLAQIEQASGGGSPQVLAWLKKAREADKASVPANLALARFYMSYNQPKDAIPALQEALAATPEQIDLLDTLGTAYLKAGDDAQAIATFEKILRLRADSAPMHLRMGEFYIARKDTDRALTYFRKAAELAPKSVEAKAAIASALAISGKITEARAMAATIQKDAPKSAAGAALDGDILNYEKKYAEAAAAYRRALAVQATVGTSVKLHRSLMLAGNETEADATLKRLLTDYPNDTSAKLYVGSFEIGRKRWQPAIAAYQSVLKTNPEHAVALNNMAWAMHELKDPQALSVAQKAISVAPNAPDILDTYGTILLASGDAAKAVEVLQRSVGLAPKQFGFRVRLAEALIATGKKAEARKELEQVLGEVKSGPLMEQAQALVKKL